VELDVFTFTSESLDTHMRLQAEKIRNGQIPAPEQITLRILLPSDAIELPYPRARAAKKSAPDVTELDRILEARTREIIRRHTSSLRNVLRNLKTDGLVPDVEVLVREVPLVPTRKRYLRRGVEGLIGPYKIMERTILMDDDTEIDAWDVLGLGSTLICLVHDEATPTPSALCSCRAGRSGSTPSGTAMTCRDPGICSSTTSNGVKPRSAHSLNWVARSE
jgi:hypothetical protein